MLLSSNKQQCNAAYESASSFLANDPRKLDKLNRIFDNPSYYFGYIIRGLVGNLKSRGSVPSEQNHASIFAYLGSGDAGMSIMRYLSQLLKRAQDHSKKRRETDNRSQVAAYKYVSSVEVQIGIDDIVAKKALSPYAYKMLYIPASKASLFLQSDVNQDDKSTNVWPAATDKTPTNCYTIK